MIHNHCLNCFSIFCIDNECRVVPCKNGCAARLHECKMRDHYELCPLEIVPCIIPGCELTVLRVEMADHIYACPSNTVICSFQWVRKMMLDNAANHSQFKRKPRDSSQQLDLALTFYDQHRGRNKLLHYVGKDGARACQAAIVGKENFAYSYSYNPAHPAPHLRWYKTGYSQLSQIRRPPFMNPVPSFLQNSAAYTPPPLLHWTRPVYLIAQKLPDKDKVLVTEKPVSPEMRNGGVCRLRADHSKSEQCTRVETSFSCYNVIAINNLPVLQRTESSLHLSCGHLLRRDQLTEHCHSVHNTIMAGIMDGWLVERCPLAGYGCEFYQFRLQPKGGRHVVRFDEELGVFYLEGKKPLPPPITGRPVPVLPSEIWCLIGQYCDNYTLAQLCLVSQSLRHISNHLLVSRGVSHHTWSRSRGGPRCYSQSHQVTEDPGGTTIQISCHFAACKRWECQNEADWSLTASLTSSLEWEFVDRPHISCHLSRCEYNIRTEHRRELADVYGRPLIDPSVILRNFNS